MNLEKMKVRDLLETEEFMAAMADVIRREKESHNEARYKAAKAGMRLGRSPIDSLTEREVFEVEIMRKLYEAVLNKTLIGFSAMERQYIDLVGQVSAKIAIKSIKEKDKEHTS